MKPRNIDIRRRFAVVGFSDDFPVGVVDYTDRPGAADAADNPLQLLAGWASAPRSVHTSSPCEAATRFFGGLESKWTRCVVVWRSDDGLQVFAKVFRKQVPARAYDVVEEPS